MGGAGRAKVAIVGGGFGGLAAARALAGAPVEVTLVDRRGEHVFQPLLGRVATGQLEPAEVRVPLQAMLRGQDNVAVLVEEVRAVDAARSSLRLADGTLGYDLLVLAAGAAPCYLGHEGWRAIAPTLHTLEDALEIRARLRGALSAALAERDAERRGAWLTFAVVGAGPTGVELAGGIAGLVGGLPVGHPGRAARVLLFERGPRVLAAYPPAVALRALELLDEAGVEVRTHAAVAGVDPEGVRLPGERVAARTVLWAAGVAGAPIGRSLTAPVDGAGRLEVRGDLSVPLPAGSPQQDAPRIFAVGDLASIAEGPGRVPGTAAAAIQAGRHAAHNVLRVLAGESPLPFRHASAGRLAAVGRTFVGHVGPFELPPALAAAAARVAHARWLWPARAGQTAPPRPLPARARTA